jgi:hypothetical protein
VIDNKKRGIAVVNPFGVLEVDGNRRHCPYSGTNPAACGSWCALFQEENASISLGCSLCCMWNKVKNDSKVE